MTDLSTQIGHQRFVVVGMAQAVELLGYGWVVVGRGQVSERRGLVVGVVRQIGCGVYRWGRVRHGYRGYRWARLS